MTKEELIDEFCNQSLNIENNLWELKLWNPHFAFIGQNSNSSTAEKSAHTLIIHENSNFTSNILIEKKEKNVTLEAENLYVLTYQDSYHRLQFALLEIIFVNLDKLLPACYV